MNLSLEGVGSYSPPLSEDQPGVTERLQKAGTNTQRRVHAGAGVLRRTPAVSPGSAEEDDMMPVNVPQVNKTLCLNCCVTNNTMYLGSTPDKSNNLFPQMQNFFFQNLWTL